MCGLCLKGDSDGSKKKIEKNKENLRKNFIQGKIHEYDHDKGRK